MSAKSRNPETDDEWAKHDSLSPKCAAHFIALCGQMERERDMARAAANTFRQCAELTFGPMPFPRKFHWENADLRQDAGSVASNVK